MSRACVSRKGKLLTVERVRATKENCSKSSVCKAERKTAHGRACAQRKGKLYLGKRVPRQQEKLLDAKRVRAVKENRRYLSACSPHKKTASLKACVRRKGKLC